MLQNEIRDNLRPMQFIKFLEMRQALGGIDRTDAEERSLAWIAMCEPETINNLINIFYKLRKEGR